MRLLVTGAAGQVGTEVVRVALAAGDEVTATDLRELDITDRDAVLACLHTVRPDAVVHCAAMTAVDLCESEHERAWLLNALAVRHLAEACRRTTTHLVHLSTDYVFDGTKDGPYLEWDTPCPTSVYGASKLGGEREVDPISTLVRTSWVNGVVGGNITKTVLRLAEAGTEMAFVTDQRGHPTFAADLAVVLRRLALERRPGTFHVTNQGPVSWFEFVQAVLEAAGHPVDLVRPITTLELQPPRPAPRPANSVLDNAALRLSGLPLLPDFHEPLARLVRDLAVAGHARTRPAVPASTL